MWRRRPISLLRFLFSHRGHLSDLGLQTSAPCKVTTGCIVTSHVRSHGLARSIYSWDGLIHTPAALLTVSTPHGTSYSTHASKGSLSMEESPTDLQDHSTHHQERSGSGSSRPISGIGWERVQEELSSYRAAGGREVLSDPAKAVATLQRISFAWAEATGSGGLVPSSAALESLEALPGAVSHILQSLMNRCESVRLSL